jgi:glutathione synthase/RimK-type ligase-like ATP-grasp enzyme
MFYVYTPRPSKSARALARALKGRRVRDLSRVQYGDTVINWGNSGVPPTMATLLNLPSAIGMIANKRIAFDIFRNADIPIPGYATTKEGVTWKGDTVVRHKLTGHSGEGIEMVKAGETLPDAHLYVQYIRKEQEYRVHVGRRNDETTIIAVQRKARRKDVPDEAVNWQVRNHKNGFIFAREGFTVPDSVLGVCKSALLASGLDFGAVDVIYNAKEGKAYVLEINTAPGLEGQTIADYAQFFRGQ